MSVFDIMRAGAGRGGQGRAGEGRGGQGRAGAGRRGPKLCINASYLEINLVPIPLPQESLCSRIIS